MIAGPGEVELPRLRQGLYRFFATALLPPREARIEQLTEAADLLEDLGVDTLAFAGLWRDMGQALATRPPLEAIEVQYVHLFEAGSDGALCPPVESFYMSSPRHGGPAVVAAELEVEYGRLGFTVSDKTTAGVDHVSSQLELMALLCAKEATAGECADLRSVAAWNHEQQRFTDNHLSQWIRPFAARVREATPAGLYQNVVDTLDAFVDHDRELLHVLERQERTGPRQ